MCIRDRIDIKQTYDEDENMPMAPDYFDEGAVAVDSELEDSYSMEDPDDENGLYDGDDFDDEDDENADEDDGFDF